MEGNLASWSADLAFRSVVEATADKAGLDFMRHLVKNLSQSLGVDYAFIAEFADAADRVRTIAFWNKDDWAPNIEYSLPGTPCEKVIEGGLCLFEDEVQCRFPGDRDLVNLGARSYLGVPLRGANGQTLGHLAALDTRPMSNHPDDLAIFDVFANRARVEIERLHAEEILKHACDDLVDRLQVTQEHLDVARQDLDLAYDELQALLEINQSSSRHLNRDDLFAELARSVKPLLPCERFGIEEPTGPETLRVHVLALDQPARGPMKEEFPSTGTACRWAQENQRPFVAHAREALRDPYPMTHAVMEREGMESVVSLPLLRESKSFGALFFMSTRCNAYAKIPSQLLERVASAVAVALDNCQAYEEVSSLRDRLAAENSYLQEEVRRREGYGAVIGHSVALERVLALARNVARISSTVLILGETGTGKELIAREIHNASPRRDHTLVTVNCSAISAGLVESELFGHVRGAFTGAVRANEGRFALADGGTIFLDEVGELPLETQVKLLRVLQEHEIEPVGNGQPRAVDVRVIAATNRDLELEVAEGRFRADLYYRLNVVPILVPPLRDRCEDIPELARFFAERFAGEMGKYVEGVSPRALECLSAYHWPGNVRELSNLMERAVVLAESPVLDFGPEFLPALPPARAERSGEQATDTEDTLEAIQRRHIVDTLERRRWVIEGTDGAAAALDISPSTLRHRLQKLGISRPISL